MIEFEKNSTQLRITIPISGIEKLLCYQQAIRGVLRKIEIGNCEPELKENIKAMYELLKHLRSNEDFLNQHKELLKERGLEKNRKVVA